MTSDDIYNRSPHLVGPSRSRAHDTPVTGHSRKPTDADHEQSEAFAQLQLQLLRGQEASDRDATTDGRPPAGIADSTKAAASIHHPAAAPLIPFLPLTADERRTTARARECAVRAVRSTASGAIDGDRASEGAGGRQPKHHAATRRPRLLQQWRLQPSST